MMAPMRIAERPVNTFPQRFEGFERPLFIIGTVNCTDFRIN